jgi:general secretion pathway protein K
MISPTPEPRPRRDREDGFALIIVLWIFIVLFVLGAEFSQAMRQDAVATSNFADETQSYYLASAAANLTFYRALQAHQDARLGAPPLEVQDPDDPQPPVLVQPDGEWHPIDLWGAQVWVKVADEGGKIPINWADETVLNQVLVNLGVEPKEASTIADSVLDWRDRDDEHRLNGAESDYYESLPRPYIAKNAPLDSIEELLLVKGVTPELFYGGNDDFPIGLREIFTIFTPRKNLNVQHAPPEVLKAFFGLDDEELEQMLSVRNGSGAGLLDVLKAKVPDPRLSEMLSSEISPTVLSVEVQAQLPSSKVKAHLGAVIDLGESSEGVYILRWMDQLPPVDVS